MKNYNINMSWDGIVIKKSFLYVSVYMYSDRVLQLFFYPFWYLNYRYWSLMGFTQNILCSLFDY